MKFEKSSFIINYLDKYVGVHGEEKVDHAEVAVPDRNHDQRHQRILPINVYFVALSFVHEGAFYYVYYAVEVENRDHEDHQRVLRNLLLEVFLIL